MELYGLEINIKSKPELDPSFIPLQKFNEAFLETAKMPFSFAIERNDKQIAVISTYVHGDKSHKEADCYYLDRLVKFQLWQKGGFRIYVKGAESLFEYLKFTYSPQGSRSYDADFYGRIYGQPFEVILCDELPRPFEIKKALGRNFDGYRIGVDFGGSDYKVAAVVNGEAVYSNETVWNPKINSNPDYHFNGVVSALKEAGEHLPQIDAIGISSAGLIGNNRILAAQLFQMVPMELFEAKGRDIYFRAVAQIGEDVPFEVANDGDVAALAGSIGLDRYNVLGLAMGTSFIGGFVDKEGNLSNWLSELAFAPVDASPNAAQDDWTKDIGVGVQYFCQEAVIKLAPAAGITLEGYDTPAKKLKAVQNLLAEGHTGATAIFRSIGCYLGHTAAYYYESYGADSILLYGRVVSGMGGDIVLEVANSVLKEEYPNCPAKLMLPDEHTRRLGQSVAAASLPIILK
jgi:predicted NBD/HSP70 family sugar kinase